MQGEAYTDRPEKAPRCSLEHIGESLGIPMEEVAERAIQNIRHWAAKSEKSERYIRRHFTLDPDLPLDDALRKRAGEALQQYALFLPEKVEQFASQLEHCMHVATTRGYTTDPGPVRLRVSDSFLYMALPDADTMQGTNFFDPDHDLVSVDINATNKMVAHETGHCLSYDKAACTSGFQRTRHAEGEHILNEGATTIWEDISCVDGSEIAARSEAFDVYTWSKDTIREVLRMIGKDDDLLLRAYFGNTEASNELNRLVQDTFGCTFDALMSYLSVKTDIEFTKKILRGEHVDVTVGQHQTAEMIHARQRLSEIFPHVHLVDKRPPSGR